MLNIINKGVPGEFGFYYQIPLWIDTIDIDDESIDSFIDIINSDYSHYKEWTTYNIMTMDHPYINKLLHIIRQKYTEFTKKYGVETKKDVCINGWLNLLKEGEGLGKHYHAVHSNAYLSGTTILTDGTSNTVMYPLHSDNIEVPDEFKIPSIKNRLIFFPQWVYHSVDAIKEKQRVSIGFDIHKKEGIDFYWKNNSHIDYPIRGAIPLFGGN